jgi:hypothetical protein
VARRCKHADGSGEDKRIRLANVGHLAAFDDISRDRRALPSNRIVVIPPPSIGFTEVSAAARRCP